MIDGHSSERDQLPASVCKGIRKLPGLEWPPGFQESIRPKKLQTPRHKQEEQVETCATEGSLLNWMMGKFRVIDPDVLTGHNFMGFDLDLLLQRMKATGVAGANWSRIGRLRRTVYMISFYFKLLFAERSLGGQSCRPVLEACLNPHIRNEWSPQVVLSVTPI